MSEDVIYEAHLRLFLATAESTDLAERVRVAAKQWDVLTGAVREWGALLDLAVTEAYESGITQGELGRLLGKTRQMAGIRVASGKDRQRAHRKVVDAALRAARHFVTSG